MIATSLTLVLAGSVATADAARVPGEIARYDFSEGSGVIVGDSGAGAPLDLLISDETAVTWVANGLQIDSSVAISSTGSSKIAASVAATNAFTVEAWITPDASGEQTGPARIFSNSVSPTKRNFMLGQGAFGSLPDDVFAARTRTSTATGGTPNLFTPTGNGSPALTHVVLTRNSAGLRTIYVDGVSVVSDTLGGTLGNWNTSYPLVVANEATGTRPWLGTLCMVAMYDGALSAAEVVANYDAGCGIPNAEPTLDPIGAQANDEGQAVALPVTGFDSDGDALTFTASNLPDGLSIAAVDGSSALISGTITQTAAAGSVYATVINADDGNGGVASETVQWTVAAINVNPTLDPIGNQTSGELQNVSLQVTAFDADSDTLIFGATGLPPSLVIDPATGEISGVVDAGAANYSVTVTVDDGNGGNASETFDWDVIGNDDPVLDPVGNQTNDEGDLVSLTITASDLNGDPLSIAAAGLPDGLSISGLSPTSAQITGTIAQTAGGTYSITVSVNDGNGGTDNEIISWTVNPVNVDPALDPIADQNNNVGATVALSASATDVDGDTLTFGATGLPTGVAIDPATGAISGTATADGTFAVTVSVSDGNGGSASTSFTWNVNIVTGPAAIAQYNFDEGVGTSVGDSGSGTSLNLTISDPSAVTWVADGLQIDASVTIASAGSAKITNAVAASGQFTIEAWITPDASGPQDGPARIVASAPSGLARNFMLAQGAYGSLPDDVFAARTRTTNSTSGTPNLFTGTGTADPVLTHVVLTFAGGNRTIYVDGIVAGSDTRSGALTNWNATYPLVVGNVGSGDRPWLGTVCRVAVYDTALNAGEVTNNFSNGCGGPPNSAPVLDAIINQTNDEADSVSLTVTASDIDADALVFSATNLPDGLTITPIDATSASISGTITQTAASGSIYATEITVDDNQGGTDSQTIDWAITAVNVDPVLDPITDQVSGDGQAISLTATANDADGDVLIFSATGLPPMLSIDTATGEISGTIDPPAATYNVTIAVADGNGGTDSVNFDWDVTANTDPVLDVIWLGSQTNDEGDTISLTITGSDIDGDSLTFAATGLPDGLSISPVDATSALISGTITQTAASGSVYSTQVTVTDGKGGSADETVSWTVNPVNVDPALDPIADQNDNVGATVALSASATDVDGDTLTFGATGLPTGVAIDPATGAISGTATADGTFAVTVSVSDGNGGSAVVTFDWDVTVVTGPAPLVRYDFTEGSGTTVGDSGSGVALDLTISDLGAVNWAAGGGLQVDSAVTVASIDSSKIGNAVSLTNEITVEAWIIPEPGLEQSGPARIVSSSPDALSRNIMLGQGAYGSLPDDVFAARTRTSSSNGGTPTLFTTTGTANAVLTHVVLTRDASGLRTIYLDGVAVGTDTLGGDLSSWDNSYPLVLANVGSGVRPWIGTLCRVAIYDIALAATEVSDNFGAGCELPEPTASALVQVTPGGPIGATTFGNSTITVTNTGAAGAPAITNVFFDVRGSLIPDVTFDPIGTAGDEGTQCLAVSLEGGTGFVAPGDPCTDPFSLPHEDDPGVPANGWDGMELDFTDFTPGEAIVFGVDVDPTSIQGVPGAGGSGAVSGLELSGSSVTVSFSDGSTSTSQLFGDGSVGGGEVAVGGSVGQVAPGISMVGVSTSPTVFTNNSVVGTVPAVGSQTVQVSGPIGATVTLLAVEGNLESPTPFDLDPFESDTASVVTYQTSTIGAGGTADFTVVQPNAGSLYHYVAVIDDGGNGPTSEHLVIGIGDFFTPVIDPVADVVVNEGDIVSVALSATDPNGDSITFEIVSTPDIEAAGAVFTDNGDGTASLVWTTAPGDAEVYTIGVIASDGTNAGNETFTVAVIDPNTPDALIHYEFTEGSGTTVGDSGLGTPLNLTIADPATVTWLSAGGLRVDTSAVIASVESSKVTNAVAASNAFSIEAWVRPDTNDQTGPARIVSSSLNISARNVMLGQGAFGNLPDDVFAARSLTTTGSANTTLFSNPATAGTSLTHVVFTWDSFGTRTMFVDGITVGTDIQNGEVSNWNASYPLVLANIATGSRPWLGTFCEVAIYDISLTPSQVAGNFAEGCELDVPPSALVEITPAGGLNTSTFGNATISVTNTGDVDAPSITNVSFDLRGSLIPDATFDPIGTAGDGTDQCLDVSAEGGTGYIVPVDPCLDPFSLVHEDDPGIPANGWDGMDLDFTDFTSGETIVFGVDVDPTSIQGVSGAGGAGSVSGLELTGSDVTITFSDGSVLTSQVFGDGSVGGGQVAVGGDSAVLAPTSIEMLGVVTSPSVFTNNAQAGFVGAAGPQTVRVGGPEGATITLLAVAGDLVSPTPFDEDPFESDTAVDVIYLTGTVTGGFADFTVAQTDESVLYHYIATIDDGGVTGPTSEHLIIGFGDVDTPIIDPISNVIVNEGDTVAVAINSVDPNADTITLDITSTPDIEASGAVLTDNGDGTGSIDWVTAVGNAGAYSVDVTATDGINTATASFELTVLDPNATTLYRVNAGGPLVTATDAGPDWSADQVVAVGNAGGAAVTGTPSIYWVGGEEKAYGTADVIDVSDASIPAGTPMVLFQTERYDPVAGTELTYEFPAGSGASYAVDLYFAEIFATADGTREFAVEIEGIPVLGNYDVHSLVGHDAGIVATFVSPIVSDDALTITFTHQVENPKVNAIEVRTAGPPPTDVPPAVGLIADQSMVVGGTLPVQISTFEPDGDTVTLSYNSTPDASAFTTFTDVGDGTGTISFSPVVGEDGVYTISVTATDVHGSDTEDFLLTVNEPPTGGTVFARINSGGPLVAAVDGGPDWEADLPGHPFLSDAGSDGVTGFAAVDPGVTVPATVNGAIFDTERWSSTGFTYSVPVPSGTQIFVRVFAGNGFAGTSTPGTRIYDVLIDGVVVQNDVDLVTEFGNEVGGMFEYLITSDGSVDISFTGSVQNPLVNGIEVVSAASSPDELGASPTSVDFGVTAVNTTKTQAVTLTNLGFDSGDPSITINSVVVTGSATFTTDFGGAVGLGPSGSNSFNVTFAPTTLTPQSGTMTIDHTGSNSPLTITLDGQGASDVPVSYGSGGLGGEFLSNPTSLQFGPDGRLYVVQQNATVLAYSVVRNGANDYTITNTETINLIKTTPNHNDDGSSNGTQQRQSTGIVATGTAANPVLYVSSSDWRIEVGNDSNLDTNSGVITRLTWNGSTWDKVDIVRGLPRSEENHATNGMTLDEATNTMYVAQGGHANKGAPANNFSGTPEYYLSAALLSIDLDAINALPVLNDGGTQYVYDLPTLDDPNRPNVGATSVDVGDPFGGGNGANQAIPEPGGPVQVHAPGFRNPYDVVMTEAGRLYTSDNGPNTNWGGLPLVYASDGTPKGTGPFDQGAGDYCTNEFNESDSNGHGDPLHFVSGPGYYGGHPTPIRAFPAQSGIHVYTEGGGGWTETAFYNFGDLLPDGLTLADFPDNPVECEYSADSPAKYLDIIGSSTNGIAEYTATNFGGAMQGNILTASFNGNIYRYQLNAAGDAVVESEALLSGFGGQPLDLIAQGDDDPFPGSIWAITYGSDAITVFEPQDFGSCSGADDDLIDEDLDGFSNADEIDNGTNPCSGASKPNDNDGDFISDLNDLDDDNDGILDVDDEFAIDPDNGTTTDLPLLLPLDNNDPGTGLFGLGLTGLMTNGTTDYLNQFDPATLDAGGATGKLGVTEISAGDAYQGVNTQDNAFQVGINVDTSTAPFAATTVVESPFFSGQTPQNFQSAGLFIGTGDQDNYLKVVMNANGGAGGIEVLLEDAAVTTGSQYGTADYGGNVLASSSIALSIVVDPAALTAQPQLSIDGASAVDVGPSINIPASWLDPANTQGLAVGIISTSTGPGPVFGAVWDLLNVEYVGGGSGNAPTIDPIADQSVAENGDLTVGVVGNDVDGDPLTYALSGDVPAGMAIDASGTITFTPDLDDSGTYAITAEVSDGTTTVTEAFSLAVTQTDVGTVLTRINAGGPAVTSIDAGPDWTANPNPNTLTELIAGGGSVYGGNAPPISDISDPTVPVGTPLDVFNTERYDVVAAPEMAWNFAVEPGATIEVRIGHGEIYNSATATIGNRVYDIEIDGVVVDTGIDPIADAGSTKGFVTDYVVTADADGLDLVFLHDVENPAAKSIEIIEIAAANAAPTIDSVVPASPVNVDQGVALATITVTASDTDGDPITLTTDGAEPAGLTFTDLGGGVGEFTGTPTDAPGTYSIVVTASDLEPLTATTTIDIVINAVSNSAPTIDPIADQTVAEDSFLSFSVVANDVDNDPLTYALSGDVPAGMAIDALGTITFSPDLDDSGTYAITAEVADGVNPVVTEDFSLAVTQTDVGTVLTRINAGGPAVTSTDAGPDWTANPNPNTLTELIAGGENVFAANSPISDISDPSVPVGIPIDVFNTERWDPTAAPEMAWKFTVNPGDTIEVRIGHGEIYNSGSATAGNRIYDIFIDGVEVDTGIDPIADAGPGEGFVTDYVVTADADGLDIEFVHVVDNPNPKWFEIIQIAGANTAPTIDPIADQSIDEVTPVSFTVVANDANSDPLTYALSGDVPVGMTIDAAGVVDFTPDLASSGRYAVVVEVGDGVNPAVTAGFTLDVAQSAPPGSAIHRVNVGGPAVAAADASYPDWAADDGATPSPFYVSGGAGIFGPGVGISDITNPSVPGTVPQSVFELERYGALTYAVPVDVGTEIEVRLYWAELFGGITAAGQRVFDVQIDGVTVETGVDAFAATGGAGIGSVSDYLITSDGMVDIVLLTGVQSPALKGIEILGISGVPSVTLVSPADGTTITGDSVTIDWELNGFLDPNDHVHVTVDAPPHTSVFRPDTEFTVTGLTDGTHTITLQIGDVAHTVYPNAEASQSITITVDTGTMLTTRINAGGLEEPTADSGPVWEADDPAHSTLSVPSGTSIGTWPVNGFDTSVPTYAQLSGLFVNERWDGTDDAAPDVMTYTVPISTFGGPATVNLFMMSGWDGAQAVGQRQYNVTIEGVLELENFDPVAAYGHRMGGMETLSVSDLDSDGFITIEFDHGVAQNPTVNAIEVIG